jgi:guanylate kinase
VPYPLLILTGPAGGGKRHLRNELCTAHSHEFTKWSVCGLSLHPLVTLLSVSHTTRLPRADEVDGSDYCFVSQDEMDRLIEQGAFLQTCRYPRVPSMSTFLRTYP